jgi:D-alanyl-lipoteichoic acid acyltransferase DltB (MBOAT superfamily)
VLPVGISFYTFQAISYTIDVYRNKIQPEKDVLAFIAFVSFFPQLVAGPIERATQLLPQFIRKRMFKYDSAVNGCRQMLWGLFKKMVIADNCAAYVNAKFADYNEYSGSTLLLAAVLFAFQIYGDFSGYSDIAIGVSRLFSINLTQNFAYPYFSRDISEFWKRWHISLTTWFRDYVYVPLGGNRRGVMITVRNTIIVFLLSGLWHGANWTFVAWGAINAMLFIPIILIKKHEHSAIVTIKNNLPSFGDLFSILTTFSFVVFGWIVFRSDTIYDALRIYGKIFSSTLFVLPVIQGYRRNILVLALFIPILIIAEWNNRKKLYGLENIKSKFARSFIYISLALSVLLLGGNQEKFIYFQF